MEYVMLSVEVSGVTKMVPIIFPDFMVHEDIAKAVTAILTDTHTLKSRADSHIINHYDYLHGLVY